MNTDVSHSGWVSQQETGAYWGRRPFLCRGSTGRILTTASKGLAAPLYPEMFLSNTSSYFSRTKAKLNTATLG